jgi:hypothetical protein
MNTQNGVESTLKSTDTEEFIDIYFFRPVGYWWARLFNKLGITPNQITITAIFIGITAGICFYFTDFRINLLGVFLLIWANTYDSADGQLARMTNRKSELGRILDGASGDFWFGAIYLAIVCRLWPDWHVYILLLAIIAGYCHSKQSALADYYRNVHLLFLKGKHGSELDNSKDLAEKYKKLSWKKEPVFNRDLIREPYTDAFLRGSAGKVRKGTKSRFSSKGRETIYTAHEGGALPRDVIPIPALAGRAALKERGIYCKTCNSLVGPANRKEHENHELIIHPTQKPLALTDKLIRSAKPDKDFVVLIPFAGSGSECIATINNGGSFIAYELNEDYILLAEAQLEYLRKK